MTHRNLPPSLSLVGLFALVLATGCDKKEEAPKADAKEEKKVEKKPISDLITGKAVELPAPLAKLTFGMAR